MTDQFDNMLHDAFDDFAAAERSTAKQAPGAAAVRRTVAVQRRNRYTMLGVLGAVLIALPVAAYAANPRGNNSPPVPGASATLAQSPSATASATPSDSPSASTSATVTDPVPGIYLYRLDKADGTSTHDLLHRAPGGDWQKITSVTLPAAQPPAGPPPVAMSLDRKHIAWLLNGKLQVSALDGSQVKTVLANTGSVACTAPIWSADSRRLLFVTRASDGVSSTVETVNLDGTGRKALGTEAGNIGCTLGSADGTSAYAKSYSGTKAHLVVFNGSTAPRTVTATWPSGRQFNEVIAAEAGSTRLLVSTVSVGNGCGCSPPQQYAILDTATGTVTKLDNSQDKDGSSPISGAFTSDGRVVLLADRNKGNGSSVDPFLTVFSADGAILGGAPLPSMEIASIAGIDG
jgi:hypothetical protein